MDTTATLAPTPRRTVGRPDTLANAVTLVRTVLAVVLALHGIATDHAALLVVAYAVYWFGDVADGWLARRMGQATRLGAVLDITCDRVCTTVLCAGLVLHLPQAAPAVVVFLVTFTVVDTVLSLSFLCWPIDSPNDFWRVDRRIYELNWSPLAKALNTAGVVGAVAAGVYGVALAAALVGLAVKTWSATRVLGALRAEQ